MMGDRDVLVRSLTSDGCFRVTLLLTSCLTAEIRRRHDATPGAAAAISRVASAALLVGTTLKDDHIATVQVRGDGPIGLIRATANARGQVKAYAANPGMDAVVTDGGFDLASLVGSEGVFEVIKDLGLQQPYQGLVPLVGGHIADDFTYYLFASEQTRAAVGMTEVEVEGQTWSGAYLLQLMPGADDDVAASIGQPASMGHLFEYDTVWDAMARLVMAPFKIVGGHEITFTCNCSRQRLAATLRLVGRADVEALFDEEPGPLPLSCQFCGRTFRFRHDEIPQIFGDS